MRLFHAGHMRAHEITKTSPLCLCDRLARGLYDILMQQVSRRFDVGCKALETKEKAVSARWFMPAFMPTSRRSWHLPVIWLPRHCSPSKVWRERGEPFQCR